MNQNYLRLFGGLLIIAAISLSFFKKTNTIEKTYGLFIAISDYQDQAWVDLKSAVSDANQVKDLLKDKYGFDEIITLYDAQATKINIEQSINSLLEKAESSDNILIYFAGHSTKDGDNGYWIPHDGKAEDTNGYFDHNLLTMLLQKIESKHVFIMADSYLSSSVFTPDNLSFTNDGSDNYYSIVKSRASRQALTSGGMKPTLDHNGKNSVMSKYLIKYLKDNGQSVMDVSELYEMLRIPLTANTSVSPQFGYFQNTDHEGGQFILKISEGKFCSFYINIEEGEQVRFNKYGTLHARASYNAGVTYEWLKDGAIVGNTRLLDVAESGRYSVIATTLDGCSEVANVDVVVERAPLRVRIAEETFIEFVNTGVLHAECNQTADIKYEWRKDNRVVGFKPYLRVYDSGFYTVQAYADSGRIAGSKVTGVRIVKKEKKYTVKSGDDLQRIAAKMYGDPDKWVLIFDANKETLQNTEMLMVGKEIIIPDDVEIDYTSTIYPLKIATGDNLPPFVDRRYFQDGYLTTMVLDVFDNMEQETKIDFMNWEHAANVAANTSYAVSFPYVKTKAMQERFYFSEPLDKILAVWFVRADSKIKIKDLESDKKTKKLILAQVQGYEIDGIQEYIDRGIKVEYFETLDECFEMLYKGYVDLVATGQMVGLAIANNIPYMEETDFRILEKPIGTQNLHLIVSKKYEGGEALAYKFSMMMKKMKEEGELKRLKDLHIDMYQRMFE